MGKKKKRAIGWDINEEVIRKRIKASMNARYGVWTHVSTFIVVQVVLLVIWRGGLTFGWDLPWVLFPLLAWSAGLFAHMAETYLSPKVRYRAFDEQVSRELEALYGPYWYDVIDEKTYAEAEHRVRKRMRCVRELAAHLSVFVPINLLLWLIWIFGGATGFAWPLVVTALWGIGLLGNILETFSTLSHTRNLEREVQRELARHNKRKPKRRAAEDVALHLGEDGELVELPLREH